MTAPVVASANEAALTSAVATVHAAYAKLAAHVGPNFKARPAQVDLSIQVARNLLRAEGKNILLSEAPTGTGKTLAYLIGSVCAKAAIKAVDPGHALSSNAIIVGTATKALQQQVLANDAPTLLACGIVKEGDVALAKGRANYACLRDAQELSGRLAQAVFDTEEFLPEHLDGLSASDVHAMVDAFERGEWDGDFDLYGGPFPKALRTLGSNSDTCVRKTCAYKDNCPYFVAREKLVKASVIVTNHDIVLMDAKNLSDFGDASLPVAKLNLVLDEAHHIGAKVLSICSSELQVVATQKMLPRKVAIPRLLNKDPSLKRYLAAKFVDLNVLNDTAAEESLEDLRRFLASWPMADGETTSRFRSSAVPDDLRRLASQLKMKVAPIANVLHNVVAAIKVVEEPETKALKEARKDVRVRCFELLKYLTPVVESCEHYEADERMARWVYIKGEAISLHASPVSPGKYLNKLLWDSPAVTSVSMVSATLRDMGSYDGIRLAYQIPQYRTTETTLPYTFPYGESRLVVAGIKFSPKMNERKQFMERMLVEMGHRTEEGRATLILSPSWTMLKQISEELRKTFGESAVKVQGETSIKALLSAHKRDIDAGQTSIIVGTVTMAEGMDLPGKYCEHVQIATIPFAVPTSPLEEEIQEELGRSYFEKRSLPDAMRKLMQMVGRLLRKESDRGLVTIYDNRLGNTSYGRRMLENLPPFEKIVEPLS